jgi:cytochrome c
MAADAGKGKDLFQKCVACHSEQASGSDVGPNLKGVFGRKSGALDDFRYSNAMRRAEVVWDEANLKEFITNPQAKIKGNRMPFSGFGSPGEIDDVIAYLKTLK